MRGHEHRASCWCTVLVGADHRLNEIAPHDRIQPGRRLVEDEQVGLGAHGGDERELRPLSFRQGTRLLAAVELKLCQQRRFGLAVPPLAEGRDVGERLAHGHPRIERDVVGHVGDTRFDGHLVAGRIEAEDSRFAAGRSQQIEQALDRGRFSGAVAAEEAIAAAGRHPQAEAVDGIGPSVSPNEIPRLDGRHLIAHDVLILAGPGLRSVSVALRARLRSKSSIRSSARRRNSALPICR